MEDAFSLSMMQRCLDLARLGAGRVSPNPMVGAVITHGQQIIGEGYHRQFGGSHAEVNAVNSVLPNNRHRLSESTLYVSLEPCSVYGKTPPCTDLILHERIPEVYIASLDRSPAMGGKSVKHLQRNGVVVHTGLLQREGDRLAAFRNLYVDRKRPYVILKYAQSRDGFMAPTNRAPVAITSPVTQRLVHRWRHEIDAILVGSGTALNDDPQLTNRFYPGTSPLRIILSPDQPLPSDLRLFQMPPPTLVVGPPAENGQNHAHVDYLSVPKGNSFIPRLMEALHRRSIGILMVEGGANTIAAFIEAGCWDEGRVLTGAVDLNDGLPVPHLPGTPETMRSVGPDVYARYYAAHHPVRLA